MKLQEEIRKELGHIMSEIARIKHDARHCSDDSRKRWSITLRLRELHLREKELKRNSRQVAK